MTQKLRERREYDYISGESSMKRVAVTADVDRSGMCLISVRLGRTSFTPFDICWGILIACGFVHNATGLIFNQNLNHSHNHIHNKIHNHSHIHSQNISHNYNHSHNHDHMPWLSTLRSYLCNKNRVGHVSSAGVILSLNRLQLQRKQCRRNHTACVASMKCQKYNQWYHE